jgi:hypothetical protein
LSGWGCPWWDVSRLALNLKEDILSTYYICTFSTITNNLNVSRKNLYELFWALLPKIWQHLYVRPCIYSNLSAIKLWNKSYQRKNKICIVALQNFIVIIFLWKILV